MKLRKIISLTALLSFILLIITSLFVYIKPHGKVASWANWEIWGLDKGQWEALHTNLGFLFIIVCLIHTVLNWKCMMGYLKNKSQKTTIFTANFNVALGITLTVCFLTLFNLPPVHSIQTYGESIKEVAAEKYGLPPFGHAEEATLASFCRRTRIDLDEALLNLEAAQVNCLSEEATLSEIAKENQMSPQDVYNAMAIKDEQE